MPLSFSFKKLTIFSCLLPIGIGAVIGTIYLTNTSKPTLSKLATLQFEEELEEENESEIKPKKWWEIKEEEQEESSSYEDEDYEEDSDMPELTSGETEEKFEIPNPPPTPSGEESVGGEEGTGNEEGSQSNNDEDEDNEEGQAEEGEDDNSMSLDGVPVESDDPSKNITGIEQGKPIPADPKKIIRKVIEKINNTNVNSISGDLYNLFSVNTDLRKLGKAIKKIQNIHEDDSETIHVEDE